MGIPDDESYWRRSYLPSGRATGWRCLVLYVVVAILGISVAVSVAAVLLN